MGTASLRAALCFRPASPTCTTKIHAPARFFLAALLLAALSGGTPLSKEYTVVDTLLQRSGQVHDLTVDISSGSTKIFVTVPHRIGIVDPVAKTLQEIGSATPGMADGGLLTAKFNFPMGLAPDPSPGGAAKIYIADKANNRVRKFDMGAGLITTVAAPRRVPHWTAREQRPGSTTLLASSCPAAQRRPT